MEKRENIRILIIDDDREDALIIQRHLEKFSGCTVETEYAENPQHALEKLAGARFDLIILDNRLGSGVTALDVLEDYNRRKIDVPVVTITGQGDEQTAVDLMKLGAYDYINKGSLNTGMLEKTILNAIERHHLKNRQKRLIEQLKAATEKAELMAKEALDASKAKSEFLANMSHEIRTPLNAVLGFADVLSDEELTEQQHGYLNTIMEGGRNLLDLINDILDFSKIEAGKLETETSVFSLGEILGNIDSLLRPEAIKKNLKFEILQCTMLPSAIRSDSARLRQCLINLVGNAIKFTEEGHVYVNDSLECDDDNDDKPYIRFDIEDTGIGIDPEKQQLIFDSFSQVDYSSTRKFGGTGLGLAITKRLTELLEGELTLVSEFGRGSVFSLRIPANIDIKKQEMLDKYNSVKQLNDESKSYIPSDFSGRVLIAEDNPSNLILVKLLLEKAGCEVETAVDGLEAINKSKEQELDLIIMDMQMPNMNGYKAVAALRKMGAKVPIIAVTANAMTGDEEKCIEAGCDEYLAKPVNHRELLKTIGKYLPAKEPISIDTADPAKS